MLALCATVNPGDEVILFDPYFVAYPHLVTLAGGTSVVLDTYPDFRIDVDRVRAAITPRTKAILFSSPCNPTGATTDADTLARPGGLAREKGVLLIADEIYRSFWYDGPFRSAAEFDPNVLVLDGFGKSYGITGWRLGYAHGPRRLIEEMAKLQQFTFVCAPGAGPARGGRGAWTSTSRRSWPTTGGNGTSSVMPLPAGYEFARPGRSVLRVPEGPVGDRHGVRPGGDPAQPADHPRHRLQPQGHALPGQLRGGG